VKLEYDEPLSKFAFNFNMRRYMKEVPVLTVADATEHYLCITPNELVRTSNTAHHIIGRLSTQHSNRDFADVCECV
jgi:hypothetical protein